MFRPALLGVAITLSLSALGSGCAPETTKPAMSPPEPLSEFVQTPPAPGMVWVPGCWHWDGEGYVWLPGHYETGE